MREQGLPHRPALDGLRALAVGAVLLYHGGVSWAAGGFLGVDLFFVLSGFLVTSLLLAEERRTGRLDLPAFWAARARRLLPAVAVLLVTVLWVLPASGVRWGGPVRGDAWATATYVSNWWFIGSGQSYVEQAGGPSPLLHTWSLAIEEQWYLVLPLVLAPVLRRGWSMRSVATVLALAAAASAAAAWWLRPDGADPSRAFFGTDTRLQALLVGALAATLLGGVWATDGTGRHHRASWLAVPGALALVGLAAVARPESEWLYTGGLLAVASASALLVVGAAAAPAGGGVHRVLTWRPLVAVGVVSYGIYLWHWPVYLVLDADRTGLDGPRLLAARTVATLLVAAASYRLVERPVRRQVWRQWRWSRSPARWVTAGVGCLVVAALLRPAGPAPASADSVTALAGVAADQTRQVAPPAPVHARAPSPSPDAAAPGGAKRAHGRPVVRDIVLVGDSQALSLFAAARDRPGRGVTLRLVTRFGCGVVPYVAAARGQVLEPPQPLCRDWARQREAEIASAGATLGVLFAGTWEQYDRRVDGRTVSYRSTEWLDLTVRAYTTVLAEMSRHVRHLAVVLDHCHRAPGVALPVHTLYRWGRFPPVVNDPARVTAVNRAARLAALRFPHVTVVDVDAFLCPHGYAARMGGVRLRTDGVHWTTGGGRLVWAWMRPRLLAGGGG